MSELYLPEEIRRLLRAYYTCELTTVNSKGHPISWPCLPYFHEETGEIIFSASIAFPVKALNARRHPQVALLFSDASGSGLNAPDALLIQGDASVEELTNYQNPRVIGLFHLNQQRQPDSSRFTNNRLVRRLFSWYLFQRLLISVIPKRVYIWSGGNFQTMPTEIGESHVE
jgi:hypothetical protein